MITVNNHEGQTTLLNSEKLSTKIGKKYSVTTEFIGKKGYPYCGYFGVIYLDKKGKEVDRKIRWLNDFSGTKRKVSVITTATTENLVIIYRINVETPVKSPCEFFLLPFDEIEISEDSESDELYQQVSEFDLFRPEDQEIFLERWKKCLPNNALTWGVLITGDALIDLGRKYNIFVPAKSILELGPGYGRILIALFKNKIPFKSYLAIDISQNNINSLRETYDNENVSFLQGDFSKVKLDEKYDLVLSSLTLKHQYPTFYEALRNISQNVNDGGIFCFDLLENEVAIPGRTEIKEILEIGPSEINMEVHGDKKQTYIAKYTKDEVSLILKSLNLELIAFDYVTYDEKFGSRLVVIAKKNA